MGDSCKLGDGMLRIFFVMCLNKRDLENGGRIYIYIYFLLTKKWFCENLCFTKDGLYKGKVV